MCTVSYIPASNGFFLTSNRDEQHTRLLAAAPKLVTKNEVKIIYPKDENANGTWIVMKHTGEALCLLNGAFEAHVSEPPYKRSRGLIVLDIIYKKQLLNEFNKLDLYKVEPFTLIIVEQQGLYECRWDGAQKFVMQLNKQAHYIWASSTLYPLATRLTRKNWFEKWMLANAAPTIDDIINFHTNTGDGDAANDLVMNRNNKVMTVSITCIAVVKNTISMKYVDLMQAKSTIIDFEENIESLNNTTY
jgi:hypothetical protein